MSETGESSETTTETTEETGTETAPDLTAELEKWKSLSKKNEERAKANASAAKELEQLRQQSMTEQEKAVEQAKAEARADAARTFGARLVDASVRVAAAGRIPDESVGVLLQGLNTAKFLDENGDVDEQSIRLFVDGIAPKPAEPEPQGFPDLGQGARAGNGQMALNGDPLLSGIKNALGIR